MSASCPECGSSVVGHGRTDTYPDGQGYECRYETEYICKYCLCEWIEIEEREYRHKIMRHGKEYVE